MRIAIVGAGVAGLTCAHLLGERHELTMFETSARPGGHAHTRTVSVDGTDFAVDTGFIVYNTENYPAFSSMLDDLGVRSRPSDMSFSVSDRAAGVEWGSGSVAPVLAHPRTALRTPFWRMLTEVASFNRAARDLAERPVDLDLSLAAFLDQGGWSPALARWYVVPMAAAIWSSEPGAVLQFPAGVLARFFDNHGLLRLRHRPQWRTIVGGSVTYVEAITSRLGSKLRLGTPARKIVRRRDGVEVLDDVHGAQTFDHVIVATHSDEALALLSDPSVAEREVLGAIRFHSNVATLHTDDRLLPRRRATRASWNWTNEPDRAGPTLTYDLSRLQGLASRRPICLTLNRADAVDPGRVIDSFVYRHPVFDAAAIRAQHRRAEISGRRGVSFCGAYWGYGFHEDGVQSALAVCRELGARDVR